MRTRMRAALAAAKKPVAIGAIAAVAVGVAGTGTAVAHGMIGSDEIRNQSIRSVDISRNGVGASELRGPAHASGPAVRSYHVKDQSLGHWDIKDGTLGGWDIKDGSIKEKELDQDVQDQLAEIGQGGGESTPPKGTSFADEDGSTPLPEGQKKWVASLDGEGTRLVVANVTVSAEAENGNMVCYLNDENGDVAVGNAKGERESFALTAIVTGNASLDCMVDTPGGGTATDVSMTGVEVSE